VEASCTIFFPDTLTSTTLHKGRVLSIRPAPTLYQHDLYDTAAGRTPPTNLLISRPSKAMALMFDDEFVRDLQLTIDEAFSNIVSAEVSVSCDSHTRHRHSSHECVGCVNCRWCAQRSGASPWRLQSRCSQSPFRTCGTLSAAHQGARRCVYHL